MGTQAEIMRIAVDKYLGSEQDWCQGTQARNARGDRLSSAIHPHARTYCAEGAIVAATWEVSMTTHPELKGVGMLPVGVLKGVEKVLVEQNPDFVKVLPNADWTTGCTLPLFNDGVFDVETDHIITETNSLIPSVGYEGIKSAFEKYLAHCEENNL